MKYLLFLSLCLLPLFAQVNFNGDKGLWLEQNFKKTLTDKWFVNLSFRERTANYFNTYYYEQIEATARYNLDPKLDVGLGASAIRVLRGEEWISEKTLYAQTVLKYGSFESRLRFIYVIPNTPLYSEHLVTRLYFLYRTPWTLTCLKLTPWIFNESFFRNMARNLTGGCSQNRFRVGVRGKTEAPFEYDLYLQWLKLKTPLGWNNVFDIGLTTYFSF